MTADRAELEAYVDLLREDAYKAELRRERMAVETIKRLAVEIADAAHPISHWGDGYGGGVLHIVATVLRDEGVIADPPPSARASKERNRKKISRTVERRVFAQYAYTCNECGVGGTEADLTLDHIYPHSLGGTDDEDNLRPLCRPCNSRKGAKVLE